MNQANIEIYTGIGVVLVFAIVLLFTYLYSQRGDKNESERQREINIFNKGLDKIYLTLKSVQSLEQYNTMNI